MHKLIRKWAVVLGLALALLAAQGCVSSSAGITTSNIPLEGKRYKVLGAAKTSVSWFALDIGIVGFPLSVPPVDAALKELMQEKNGNALINIRYSTDRMIFGPVSIHRFHVEADVVQVEEDGAGPDAGKK